MDLEAVEMALRAALHQAGAAALDRTEATPTRGALDEKGRPATLQSIANPRSTLGMFGSGFIEMLARQMTDDLQRSRDKTPPGGSNVLDTKGVSFGVLSRTADGCWDTSKVEGLSPLSVRPA